MTRDKLTLKQREYETLTLAILMLCGVFGSSLYCSMTPQTITEEISVFDSYESKGQTFVLTYGKGKYSFQGSPVFEQNKTYLVSWRFPRASGGSKYGINVILLNMEELT